MTHIPDLALIVGPRAATAEFMRHVWDLTMTTDRGLSGTSLHDSQLMREAGVAHVRVGAQSEWVVSDGVSVTPASMQGALTASTLVILLDLEEGVAPVSESLLRALFATAPACPVLLCLYNGDSDSELTELLFDDLRSLGCTTIARTVVTRKGSAGQLAEAALARLADLVNGSGYQTDSGLASCPAGLAVSAIYESVKVVGKNRIVTPIPFGLALRASAWSNGKLELVGGEADGTQIMAQDMRWFGKKPTENRKLAYVSITVRGSATKAVRSAFLGVAGTERRGSLANEVHWAATGVAAQHHSVRLVSPLWSLETDWSNSSPEISLPFPVALWVGPVMVVASDDAGKLLALLVRASG